MGGLRFETVRDVYEAWQTAEYDVGIPASDQPSLRLLQSLRTEGAWDAAISFCAYLLPRREAVWWGCQCLRRLKTDFSQAELVALEAAEAWVHAPDEALRWAALNVGMSTDGRLPAAWMALAAGWSGGSILPASYGPSPSAPHQTARAVRAGILVAMTQVPTEAVAAIAGPCIDSAVALVLGEGA